MVVDAPLRQAGVDGDQHEHRPDDHGHARHCHHSRAQARSQPRHGNREDNHGHVPAGHEPTQGGGSVATGLEAGLRMQTPGRDRQRDSDGEFEAREEGQQRQRQGRKDGHAFTVGRAAEAG